MKSLLRHSLISSLLILLGIWSLFATASGQILFDMKSSDQDMTYLGANRGDALSPIAIGDFNGDRVKDILLGAPFAEGEFGQAEAGAAYIVLGVPGGIPDHDLEAVGSRLTVFGCNIGDHLGTAVAAGDVNGDGLNDIVLGAPGRGRWA